MSTFCKIYKIKREEYDNFNKYRLVLKMDLFQNVTRKRNSNFYLKEDNIMAMEISNTYSSYAGNATYTAKSNNQKQTTESSAADTTERTEAVEIKQAESTKSSAGSKVSDYNSYLSKNYHGDGEYVIDILEPHDPTRIDNLGKAKGFAEYARQNPGVGRIQLIRMKKDAANNDRFKRLDMAKSAVRDKVSHAMTNDELDHIFETDGFFM
jgi:hypothetical protein